MKPKRKIRIQLTIDPDVYKASKKLFNRSTGISLSAFVELTLRHGMETNRSLGNQFRLFADDLSTMVEVSKKPPKPKRPPGRPKKIR